MRIARLTAWNSSQSTDARAEPVDHVAVPTVLRGIFGVGLDDLSVRWLQVLATRRLDLDDGVAWSTRRVVALVAIAVKRRLAVGVHVAVHGAVGVRREGGGCCCDGCQVKLELRWSWGSKCGVAKDDRCQATLEVK